MLLLSRRTFFRLRLIGSSSRYCLAALFSSPIYPSLCLEPVSSLRMPGRIKRHDRICCFGQRISPPCRSQAIVPHRTLSDRLHMMVLSPCTRISSRNSKDTCTCPVLWSRLRGMQNKRNAPLVEVCVSISFTSSLDVDLNLTVAPVDSSWTHALSMLFSLVLTASPSQCSLVRSALRILLVLLCDCATYRCASGLQLYHLTCPY